MTRQLATLHTIIPMAILFVLMFTASGCSNSADLATEISGKWKNEQDSGIVDINLAKESSSLTIGGHTFECAVEDIDKGSDTVRLRVTTEGGDTEVWSIHQVWNNNGSAFKLKLRRNGTTEILLPAVHS